MRVMRLTGGNWFARVQLVGVAVGMAVWTGEAALPLRAASGATVTQVATGLNDPRGIAFGRQKNMYVAEAGIGGGTLSTVGLCDQVQPPVGSYLGGATGRVVEIVGGVAVAIADGLPSAEASPLIGGDKSGVADVAVFGDDLLALVSGA